MRNLTVSAVAAGVCATALALAAPAHADLAPGLYQYRSVMATGATEDISIVSTVAVPAVSACSTSRTTGIRARRASKARSTCWTSSCPQERSARTVAPSTWSRGTPSTSMARTGSTH